MRKGEDQSRLVGAWAIERTELAAVTGAAIRERDAEIAALRAEIASLKDVQRRAEESAGRLSEQLQARLEQSDADKKQTTEELRKALAELGAAAANEAALSAEKLAQEGALGRTSERVAQLEAERAATRVAHEAALAREREAQQQEVQRLRTEIATHVQSADERVAALATELAAARAEAFDLQAALAKSQIDSVTERDAAVDAAKMQEKERFSAAVADLKLRLDAQAAGRREVEERADGLLRELKVGV